VNLFGEDDHKSGFLETLLRASKPGRAYTQVQQNNALAELAEKMGSGEVSREQGRQQYAGITGDFSSIYGAGSKKPALLQIAEAYQSGDSNKRNVLEIFSKVFDKGITTDQVTGQAMPVAGYGGALGQIGGAKKFWEKTGELTATGQLKPQIIENIAAASARGSSRGGKEANIGSVLQQTGVMLKTIDNILADEEGLEASTGGPLGIKGRTSQSFGGLNENQRRFQAKADQLKGQVFLDAYEALKGAGVITEIEGAKAEDARARLQQAQEPKDYRKALMDLRKIVTDGRARAKKEAGVGAQTPAPAKAAKRLRYNIEKGSFE